MTTQDLITRARQLLAAATPGPIFYDGCFQLSSHATGNSLLDEKGCFKQADGEFYAFAHNHLGEILDVLDQFGEKIDFQEELLIQINAKYEAQIFEIKMKDEGLHQGARELKDLEARCEAQAEEISLDDKLISNRNKVLAELECPIHEECVPGAIEQIRAMKAKIKAQESAIDVLRNYKGGMFFPLIEKADAILRGEK